jgi:C_GCAxxG_C_C family probable redox protein
MIQKKQSMSRLLREGLSSREDLNCAEAVLTACDRGYDLQLPKEALKLAAGFGGGMGIESTCGALTGGIMALSALFVRDRGHESDYVKTVSREFFDRFRKQTGSIDCDYLKKTMRSETNGCIPVMLAASIILEDIIDREIGNNGK